MESEKETNKISVDINSNDFYNVVQDEIETDLARLKKNVEVINNLRMSAAEMEVETAALYHAELLHHIEELEALNRDLNAEISKYNSTKQNEKECLQDYDTVNEEVLEQ